MFFLVAKLALLIIACFVFQNEFLLKYSSNVSIGGESPFKGMFYYLFMRVYARTTVRLQ